ncbi:MAG: hypothetical protein ACO32J_09230 [Phycisphaerales bacterium]
MTGTLVLALTLALQGAPASRPAAPIAVTQPAEAGPSLSVPAELARLTTKDTVAVVFVPNAAEADEVARKLTEASGPASDMMPMGASFRQLLKEGIRTDLDIPMDQPVLWWIELPPSSEDEPGMGMSDMVFHSAFRIPGAEAAMTKAREQAQQAADPAARATMPIRARQRRSSVSVLAGDLVVLSSVSEPFAAPAEGSAPSALLERLPMSAVCGRLDLGRVMADQGDQLRMLGGLASMGLSGGFEGMDQGDAKETDAQKRQRAVKRQLADAVGRQIDSVVDVLMQLKRATFAVVLEGDDLNVWADWSRGAAFPAGLSPTAVQNLCSMLPAGMSAYFGISTSAMGTLYSDKLDIDDAFATLGATPEQRAAYERGMQKARMALEMIQDGAVGGMAMTQAADMPDASVVMAFRVNDAKAFRTTLGEGLKEIAASGLATIDIQDGAADLLQATVTPSAVRMQDMMGVFGDADQEAMAEAIRQATVPSTFALRFKGNEVLATQGRGDKPVDPAALARAGAQDIRGMVAAQSWGTADWFGVVNLRPIVAASMQESAELAAADRPDEKDADKAEAAAAMRKGGPMLIRLWQGVQGDTARLSLRVKLSEWRKMVEDMEAASKRFGEGDDEAEEEDGDDDEAGDDEPM